MKIEDVLRKYQYQLRQHPEVTGVGIGEKDGKQVIIVFFKDQVPELKNSFQDRISGELDGYEVVLKPEIRIG